MAFLFGFTGLGISSKKTDEQSFTLYQSGPAEYRLFNGAAMLPGVTANLPYGKTDHLDPDGCSCFPFLTEFNFALLISRFCLNNEIVQFIQEFHLIFDIFWCIT
jgi:hypothetical protein